MEAPWILVPLGNPGPEYAETRHNLGRRHLLRWMDRQGHRPEPLDRFRTGTLYALAPGIRALVPATYMNLSGQVCAEARAAGHDPARWIVLLDDKDLALGTGRLRLSGQAHGHNGLESILQHVGTDQVARLRLGIAPFTRPLHEFVLGTWTPGELQRLEAAEAPFAAFMARLSGSPDLGTLAAAVNPAAFWTPGSAS